MERPTWVAGGIGTICLLLTFGGCDCEERLRDAVSRDNVQKHFEDTEQGAEPREKEPNDVPEQATLIKLGEMLRDVEGEIADRDDRDWLSLQTTTDERRLITVRVVPNSDEFDPIVQIQLDSSDSERLTYDNREAGEAEEIRNLALTGDVRRVGIRGRGSSTGAYTVEFERRLTAGAIEREPNDAQGSATRYEFPGDIQGFYDRPGDVDWFHVLRQDATPGIYRLNVKPTGSFAQTVRLYTRRDAEEPYASFQVPEDRELEVPNVRVPEEMDGLWFRFSAGQEYESDAGYRLRMVEHPEETERTVETEPNDAKEESLGIEVGERVAGYLHVEDDRDRFHLAVGRPLPEAMDDRDAGGPDRDTGAGEETEDTGADTSADEPDAGADRAESPIERVSKKESPDHVIQVGLEPQSDSEQFRLVWWKGGPDGEKRTFRASEAGEPVKLCNYSTDRALLHLGIAAEEFEERSVRRGFSYELSSVDIAEELEGLEIEPNDRRDDADRLEFGKRRTGYISSAEDSDVFAFGVPKSGAEADSSNEERGGGAGESESSSDGASPGASGEPAGKRNSESSNAGPPTAKSVRIELRGNELNLGFEVLDSAGARVARVDRGGAGVDESTSIDLPPGLYFVRVESNGGSVCEPYSLTVVRGEGEGQ